MRFLQTTSCVYVVNWKNLGMHDWEKGLQCDFPTCARGPLKAIYTYLRQVLLLDKTEDSLFTKGVLTRRSDEKLAT